MKNYVFLLIVVIASCTVARAQTSQPVKNPLAFPNQHYNSITSWGIDSKGEIKHVYA